MGVARASRGICRVSAVCGECVVFAGWPAYRGRAFAEASRGHRVVFAGYGRVLGGECVVFAGCGRPTGGRAFAEASHGRRVVFAGYGRVMGGECVLFAGMGGVWAGNAWYLQGGRPTRGRGVRVVFAG